MSIGRSPARENLDKARLLLLYDRRDFVRGEWHDALRERVADMTERMPASSRRRAQMIFGRAGQEEVRLAQFLTAEMPAAAVRQHLLRREPPPSLVDRLIQPTWRAIVADYRMRRRKANAAEQAV